MQPGTNFSAIDDLAHRHGVDLHIAGHVHIYQRFFPLRTSPYGPSASRPNNKPADWDHACAKELPNEAGSIYTNPKYMTQIVAGSPGDVEVTSGAKPARHPFRALQWIRNLTVLRVLYGGCVPIRLECSLGQRRSRAELWPRQLQWARG